MPTNGRNARRRRYSTYPCTVTRMANFMSMSRDKGNRPFACRRQCGNSGLRGSPSSFSIPHTSTPSALLNAPLNARPSARPQQWQKSKGFRKDGQSQGRRTQPQNQKQTQAPIRSRAVGNPSWRGHQALNIEYNLRVASVHVGVKLFPFGRHFVRTSCPHA